MANYQALRTELEKPDLSSLSNEAAAGKLNGDVARVDLVPGRYLDERGVYAVLAEAVGDEEATTSLLGLRQAAATNPTLAFVVDWLRTNIGVPDAGVDFGLQKTHDNLDALSGVVFSPAAVAALKAYGTRSVSRAVEAFGLPVTAADVATARSL